MQMWIFGSLILYIVIQLIIIGFIVPAVNKLTVWLNDPANRDATSLPAEQQAYSSKANNLFWVVSVLGAILFIFMIMKPVIWS